MSCPITSKGTRTAESLRFYRYQWPHRWRSSWPRWCLISGFRRCQILQWKTRRRYSTSNSWSSSKSRVCSNFRQWPDRQWHRCLCVISQTLLSVVELPRKRGRKTAVEVLEHQYLVKSLAQGPVNNHEQHHLAYGYCNATSLENLCSALVCLMMKDPALMEATKGRNGSTPALVVDTLEVLDWCFPP